jgi:hypothetical protein
MEKQMANDIEVLEALNRDYIASVQNGDVAGSIRS